MREMKFRGKRIDTGEWVYGDLIHGVGSKKGKMYILPRVVNLAKLPGCHPLDGYEVHPESVGQFTGLKDKNGVEIYEKDLIKYTDNPTGRETGVYEVQIDAGFIGIEANSSLHLNELECHIWVEVIGNITDKKLLL